MKDAQEIDKMAEDAEKILIIGSGLVGLDAAYGLIERGKKVTHMRRRHIRNCLNRQGYNFISDAKPKARYAKLTV